MKLDGRRVSGNVRDIRGKGGKAAGIGIGGVIVIGLITLLMGGNPLEVLNMVSTGDGYTETYTPSAEEEELATFAKQILAGTEDVWTDIFKQMGLRYEPPTLVLFSGSVQSGCGGATASTGPFYCSADKSVYLDLSFFTSMKRNLALQAISPTHMSSHTKLDTTYRTFSAP